MKVNSRGRVPIHRDEAPGKRPNNQKTLKGSNQNVQGLTLSGSVAFIYDDPWASRKAARPRLLN